MIVGLTLPGCARISRELCDDETTLTSMGRLPGCEQSLQDKRLNSTTQCRREEAESQGSHAQPERWIRSDSIQLDAYGRRAFQRWNQGNAEDPGNAPPSPVAPSPTLDSDRRTEDSTSFVSCGPSHESRSPHRRCVRRERWTSSADINFSPVSVNAWCVRISISAAHPCSQGRDESRPAKSARHRVLPAMSPHTVSRASRDFAQSPSPVRNLSM